MINSIYTREITAESSDETLLTTKLSDAAVQAGIGATINSVPVLPVEL